MLQIHPTSEDKNRTQNKLNNIYKQSLNNVVYFDSIAYKYQSELQNKSGVFDFTPDDTIPLKILNLLQDYNGFPKLLIPTESDNKSFY